MELVDLIGWAAGLILLLTVGRQVYTQWKSGKSAGVSRWLFIGQMAASVGFIVYSLMLDNWVFVVTNMFMLITAIIGQALYWRNQSNTTLAHDESSSGQSSI